MTLTFNKFGSEGSIVERLRLGWTEGSDCYVDRTSDFEKIALSDTAVASSKKGGSGVSSAANAVGSKKGGGILGRLTDKILDTAASTVEKVIDKKAKELSGDDEDPPQK